MELILPLYSGALVMVYYGPVPFPDLTPRLAVADSLKWLLWAIAGGLGGLLAVSALFLAFCLLYSPIYLFDNAPRLLDRQAWIDQTEVRFYLGCFALLCALVMLAVVSPEAALVAFVLLAGSAQVLCRLLA